MANTTVFFCKECGFESSKWLGKCPSCNNWNSFIEEKVIKKSSSKLNSRVDNSFNFENKIQKLTDIVIDKASRINTGYSELNRVFGGGLVEGSLTLIGGEPGIRKIHFNNANL